MKDSKSCFIIVFYKLHKEQKKEADQLNYFLKHFKTKD